MIDSSMHKSMYGMVKTTEMTTNEPNIIRWIPKLKKNKRIELRWGQQYYTALQDAIFLVKSKCCISSEMPVALRGNNEITPKNYVCNSCGDSFHFQSSFDEHNARYSWILGYWCNYCFEKPCDHTIDGKFLCLTCHNVRKSKRAYLKSKGLRKGQKVGAILLFYNQCQFFEHLKKHNVTVVDMGDIMLMPLPHNIQWNEYPQLDRVCKPLMEHMFVKRLHVMDWLRVNKINYKWWNTDILHKNLIGQLMKRYYTDSTNMTVTDSNEKLINENAAAMNINEQLSESSEDDDNPCETDVAFIDCHPVKDTLIIPKNNVVKNRTNTMATLNKPSATLASIEEINDSAKEQNIKISTSTSRQHPTNSIYNKKIIIISQESEISDKGNTSENNQIQIAGTKEDTTTPTTTTVMTRSRLSVHSNVIDDKKIPTAVKKNLSYVRTSDHKVVLPSGAKILFKPLSKPATSLLKVDFDKNSAPLVTPKFNIVKNKLKIVPAKITTSNVDQTKNDVVDCPKPSKSAAHPSTLTDAVDVLPPDKPVLPSPEIQVVENSPMVQHIEASKMKLVQSKKSTLTAKKNNVEQEASISNDDNTKPYSSQEKESMIVKYRESMEKNLQRSGQKIIRIIINNIRDVIRKYQITKKCVDVKNITARNSAAIKKFEKYLNNCNGGNTNLNTDEKINNEFDSKIYEWESHYNNAMIKPECNKCRRKLKPWNYVTGISKPATNELKFCQCYNCICHLCDSKLGNVERYQAHIRFHKKEAPFVCPECCETFITMFHLETHIWTKCFHIMTQQFYSCQICEVEGFITMEDITRHYAHVHARTAVFCNECQRLFNSYSDYQAHYLEEHSVDSLILDPARFLICEFGRCLVRPENFHAHIQTHIEIAKVTYYTCPFCLFFVKDIAKNRQIIQNHVLGKHAPRLREVITLQTTRFLTGRCKFPIQNPRRYIPIAPATSVVVPTIVNSCSITSETFGLASCSGNETPPPTSVQDSSSVSRIIDEKSDLPEKNSQIQPVQYGTIMPKIVNVKSIDVNADELNNEESNRVLKLSTLPVENGEITSHKQTERITELSETNIMIEFDSNTDIHCEGAKENNTLNREANIVQTNGIKVPLVTQSEITIVPFIKEENFDAGDPPPLSPPLSRQQQSSITDENNAFSTTATVTIPTLETKNEETETAESSANDAVEMNVSLLDCEYSPSSPAKEKVTKKIMSNIQLSIQQKRRRRRPWRIALNAPNNSDIPPINYKCHLCNELISTSWAIANSHFNAKHSRDYKVTVITPMLTRLSENIMEIEPKDDSRKRKLDSSIATVKKKRRWAHKKFPDRSTSPSLGICIRQESLQDTEGNFKCKKCECLFKDVNTLREHVASNHRIRGHFLICLECGENFVVAPSLQMHLKAFHGITDPITYMAQNTAYAPDMTDELEAQERIIESNQCYVCRAVFEDKAAVDKHMRVHGMAFLNRKRIEARNALKRPEKKSDNITSPILHANKVGEGMKKKNNTNIDNQDALPESDSANDVQQ